MKRSSGERVKKVGDLFAELGFRPEGSDSVKRAFVENLVKAAGGATRSQTPQITSPSPQKRAAVKAPVAEQQLSFDFTSEPETPFPLSTKRTAV